MSLVHRRYSKNKICEINKKHLILFCIIGHYPTYRKCDVVIASF